MKNIFFKSTLIILIGTIITRIFGMFIKIIFTRIIGDGIALFSLIMPTYGLLIQITQLGLPYAISCIVSKKKYKSDTLIKSIIPIALIFDILFVFIVIKVSPFIAINLLKNEDATLPIMATSFVIPFTTISGIIKGYFFGKQNMLPNAISNVFEQLTRFIILITVISYLAKVNTMIAITAFIITSAISELVQIFVYMFFLPRKINLKSNFSKKAIVDVFSISIPSLSSRIIGSISYFFEPIILTNTLLFIGYSKDFIFTEYGIYNAYVIPLITLPSFLTYALNITLIPEISKNYHNKKYIKKLTHKILLLFLLFGIIYATIIYFTCPYILKFLYNTNKGIEYLRFLIILFPLFFLESPIVSILEGLGLSKVIMKNTTFTHIIKLSLIFFLSLMSIGIYGLIITEMIHICITIIINYSKLKKEVY